MKTFKIINLLSCLLIIAFGTLQAQDNMSATNGKQRRNVLKTNILSPLSIGYERSISPHFSLGGYYLYLPSFSQGTPMDKFGYVGLTDPSVGFSVEARLYTSKTKAPLNGFFVGGYYVFRIFDVMVEKTTSTTHFKAFVPSDLSSFGLMIGRQKIRAKGFMTGFNFGLGYYKFGNIPALIDDENSDFKYLSQLSKLRSGIGPRANFTLGYAF